MTIVIVRRDLAERADKNLPTLLQYRTHIKERSLYHTPPTFAVYVVGLVLEWMESLGGLAGMQKRNEVKAQLLYDAIASSGGSPNPSYNDGKTFTTARSSPPHARR